MNQASLDNIVNARGSLKRKRNKLNVLDWDAKLYFRAFFYIEMIYSVVVVVISIMVYFYRPVDVIYTCIYTVSTMLMTFVVYRIYRGSANRGQILFHYYILRLVLSLIIVGWSIYQIVTFSKISLELVTSLSRILKFQFIFYVLLIINGIISAAFAIFIVIVQFPRQPIQEREKVKSIAEQRNLEGMLMYMTQQGQLAAENELLR